MIQILSTETLTDIVRQCNERNTQAVILYHTDKEAKSAAEWIIPYCMTVSGAPVKPNVYGIMRHFAKPTSVSFQNGSHIRCMTRKDYWNANFTADIILYPAAENKSQIHKEDKA